jgi:hypothetical protein
MVMSGQCLVVADDTDEDEAREIAVLAHAVCHQVGGTRTLKQEGDAPLYTVDDTGGASGVADILVRDREQSTPVVVMARSGGWYRLSARCPPEIACDLEALMRSLATACGGHGGGHSRRAGATIPAEKIALCKKKLAEGIAA